MGYFEKPSLKIAEVLNRPHGFVYNVKIWLSNWQLFFKSVRGFLLAKKGLGFWFTFWSAIERMFAIDLSERKLSAAIRFSKSSRAQWKIYVEIGILHLTLGDFKKALEGFLTALSLGGKERLGTNEHGLTEKLARAYMALGQDELAAELLISAMNINKSRDVCRELYEVSIMVGLMDRPWFQNQIFDFFSALETAEHRFRTLNIQEVWQTPAEKSVKVFESHKDKFKFPTVLGEPIPQQLISLDIPPLFIHEFKDATVMGALNVVVEKRLMVFEKGNNVGHGFVSGSWPFIMGTPKMGVRVIADMKHKVKRQIKEALLISSRCTFNYYHWLVEYLPRVILRDRFLDLKPLPLLVHAQMPKQHFETLKLVAPDATLELFEDDQLLQVERLMVPSIPTTHSDDVGSPLWQSAGFCRELVTEMREKILKNLGLSLLKVSGTRRVYLSRRNQRGHKMVNEKNLEAIFSRNGFEIIYPEKLSFKEQVEVFNSSSVLAGPSGGTFANVIFCRPGAKVIVLIVDSNKEYCTHQNLAHAVGAEFYYVTGGQDKPRSHYKTQLEWMVSSFYIEPHKVEQALKTWL